jgi:hypothetical protein
VQKPERSNAFLNTRALYFKPIESSPGATGDLKQLLQALLVPDPSMPGNHPTLRINTTQQVRYQILIAFQIHQIVNPGGASKAPVAFGDWRIIPSTGAAAPQRVQ